MRRGLAGVLLLVSALAAAQNQAAEAPDAPSAVMLADASAGASEAGAISSSRAISSSALMPEPPVLAAPLLHPSWTLRCSDHSRPASECRIGWRPLLRQSLELIALQHSLKAATESGYRASAFHGAFFPNYFDSVTGQRLTRWNDGDAFAVDYVGHPMMGATAGFVFIQNDPSGRELNFSTTRAYWMSRLRATAFAAAYGVQWEIGPLSEAAIGNTGRAEYFSSHSHAMTNGTGLVDYVMTPAGGAAWMLAEDVIDRHVIWRLEGATNNRAALLGMSMLNPSRSLANLLRGKAPWHRDSRATRMPARDLPF